MAKNEEESLSPRKLDLALRQGPSKHDLRLILLKQFELGENAAAASRYVTKKYGESVLNERTAQRWFRKFSCGVKSVEDQSEGRGRKRMLHKDSLKDLIDRHPDMSVRELAEKLNVSHTTIARHLKEMGKAKEKS